MTELCDRKDFVLSRICQSLDSINSNLANRLNSGTGWVTEIENNKITLFLNGADITEVGGWKIKIKHTVCTPCLLQSKDTAQIYYGLLNWSPNTSSSDPASKITFLLCTNDGAGRVFVTSGYKVYCALPPTEFAE